MIDKRDLIGFFKAETDENITVLENGFLKLEKNPDNPQLLTELSRIAHTIKGSARAYGYYEIQEIMHKIEDVIQNIQAGKIKITSSLINIVFKGTDAIKNILQKILKDEKIITDINVVCKDIEGLCVNNIAEEKKEKISEDNTVSDISENKEEILPIAEDNDPDNIEREVYENKSVLKQRESTAQVSSAEEFIRVPLSRMNHILNLVGEIVINKISSAQKVFQSRRISKLSRNLQKNFYNITEMMKGEKFLKSDEVMRSISRYNQDLQDLHEYSAGLYDKIASEAFTLDIVIDELQNKVKEMRMLPISTITEGFPRMIRDIADKERKEVVFEINGEDTQLDKKVLEMIKTPLMHILRNCVDHGIEDPQERISEGKERFGTIKLSAYHEAGNVLILIEDDGRGMDINSIKQNAVQKRFLTKYEVDSMTENQIRNIVFMSGYSTSKMITDISGRGLGLDIARRDIESLRGQIHLDSKHREGTRFTLILPLTIAIMDILLVEVKETVFAFPVSSVSECIKIKATDISTIEGKMAMQIKSHWIPVVKLEDVIEYYPQVSDDSINPVIEDLSVVIISSMDKKIGFIVDRIIAEEEVFIKNLGNHLGKVRNVAGAAILGTGDVIIILDTGDLISSSQMEHSAVTTGKKPVSKGKTVDKNILVVDDALSTRELVRSILESSGYNVDTAVDGLNALDKLARKKYALVVSDIIMPRMNGFELCKSIKNNNAYKDMPVIFVTTQEKEEDKRRGVEAGASAYIIKGAFNQANLLSAIERLIG